MNHKFYISVLIILILICVAVASLAIANMFGLSQSWRNFLGGFALGIALAIFASLIVTLIRNRAKLAKGEK